MRLRGGGSAQPPSPSPPSPQVADKAAGPDDGQGGSCDAPRLGLRSGSGRKEDEEDHELINLPRVHLREEPSLRIGLVLTVLPLVGGCIMFALTPGARWWEPALLLAWTLYAVHTCVWPAPVWTLRGAVTSFTTLVLWSMALHQFSSRLIRLQFVMANQMFVWSRGNVLHHDAYLRSLPLGFRFAYMFQFLDLGKARYFVDEQELRRGVRAVTRMGVAAFVTMCGCVALLWLLAHRCPCEPWGALWLAREWAKVVLGSLFFISGIYLGDACYQLPLLCFAPSPQLTLRAQPLMIRPWRSRSVREWWSARFDTGMQSVLYNNAYRPMRKLGGSKAAAMLATFAFSGLIHLPIITELGGPSTDMVKMFCFFIVQAGLVALEDVLRLGPSRARTLTLLMLTSPLFTHPIISLMGFRPLDTSPPTP
jgi:hypothetical protein